MDPAQWTRDLVVKRRLRSFERCQTLPQRLEHLRAEAGPHAPRVQESVPVVDADEQGAQARSRSGRLGEAPDHELLTLQAFDFQPVVSAPRAVRSSAALRDHPFELQAARLLEERGALYRKMLAVSDRPRWVTARQETAQRRLALFEPYVQKVEPIRVQEIEGIVHERNVPSVAQRLLEQLKRAAAVGLKGDQLTVQQGGL